jgi:hypothetical protein
MLLIKWLLSAKGLPEKGLESPPEVACWKALYPWVAFMFVHIGELGRCFLSKRATNKSKALVLLADTDANTGYAIHTSLGAFSKVGTLISRVSRHEECAATYLSSVLQAANALSTAATDL